MSNVRDLIRQLAATREELYLKVARVDRVNAGSRLCDVTPLDGSAPLLDVPLQAGQVGDVGMVWIPRQGSYVVVGFFNPDTGCVVVTEELEAVKLRIDGLSVQADQEGVGLELNGEQINFGAEGLEALLKTGRFTIKNDLYSLKTALTDLINAISVLTVTTSTGPSSVPVNVASFVAIGTKLNNLLKE